MKVIKHTNTMKKGEYYTLKVVRLDELIPMLRETKEQIELMFAGMSPSILVDTLEELEKANIKGKEDED